MHKNKVIHRDLKLGNLFLNSKMEIKIGDFGLATFVTKEGERKFTVCGTPNYIAPETLKGKAEGHSYEVDNWAIGVIIYTLLFGKPPFETEEVKETYKRIQNNDYSFPDTIYVTTYAKDLIRKLLVTNPTERLSIDGIYNHDFMTKTLPIKRMLESTLVNPPNTQFMRKAFLSHAKPGSRRLEDISFYYENQEKELEDISRFTNERVLKINNEELRPPLTEFNNKVVNVYRNENKNPPSPAKDKNKALRTPRKVVGIDQIAYITNLTDLTNKNGVYYIMSNNSLGVCFLDSITIHKMLDSE